MAVCASVLSGVATCCAVSALTGRSASDGADIGESASARDTDDVCDADAMTGAA